MFGRALHSESFHMGVDSIISLWGTLRFLGVERLDISRRPNLLLHGNLDCRRNVSLVNVSIHS